jgi:hypothetical protein
MEFIRLTVISDELQQERTKVESEATRLREQLVAVEASLTRIDAALAALDGTHAFPKQPKASKAADMKKIATPSPKKVDVIQAMVATLEREPVLDTDVLRQRVEDELQKQGFNRFGLAMRLKEARQSPQFITTPAGIRLAQLQLDGIRG